MAAEDSAIFKHFSICEAWKNIVRVFQMDGQKLDPMQFQINYVGENTKIIFTGDVNQIDSPYLDKLSNGLSYLIDKIQDHPIHAHITLEKGERSELANIANDLL